LRKTTLFFEQPNNPLNFSGEQGWILARIDEKEGVIPENYVRLVGSRPNEIKSRELRQTNDRVGEGSFSYVYRGYWKEKEVALKIPKSRTEPIKTILEGKNL
jgi:hypothetical protein